MNEREMFEVSFKRPTNYFKISEKEQWEIDKNLGILDWEGEGLSEEDRKRFKEHYRKDIKKGRGKAIKHTLKNIHVEYLCSKCEKTFKTKISEYDISSQAQDCDLCGSHGSIEIVDVDCEGCGKNVSFEIRSW